MIQIDGNHLTLKDVVSVARNGQTVSIHPDAISAIERSHELVNQILEKKEPVYGVNTGFGIFSEKRIPPQDSAKLSRNLILSHAVCTGTPLDKEIVRAAMLIRANTLSKGYSGVRPVLVQTLMDMLNKGVTPVIPSQGSLGSSGDLGPLSHLALVYTTDDQDLDTESGLAEFQNTIMTGKKAMQAACIRRVILGPREGLALNNGATFSAAIGALAVCDAEHLLDLAEDSLALNLEALLGCSNAFDPRIHALRGHPGQQVTARKVLELTSGSTLLDAAGRIQDAYSLRCAPQVQGGIRDTVEMVHSFMEREINAVTDNPLIFEPGIAISGGNFHGEPVGLCMDYLKIAISELGAISERRIFHLIDGKLNGGLTPMLVDKPEDAGLNSGMMMPQYTAASLALENQSLASPDSIHSLPTSGEQEDHNANSMTAARHARSILENTLHILSIEVFTACRAIDLRLRNMPDKRLGDGTSRVYQAVRRDVPYQAGDCWWAPEIEKVKEILRNYS
jgi:histidine ammonia-lyase